MLVFLCTIGTNVFSQTLQPGLAGMAPSKWLTIRNTHAPGKVYDFPGAGAKKFTHEEYFFRAWIPVVHSKRVTVLMGPNYRTEQFELKTPGENPISKMAGWNLRSYAMDINSFIKLDSTSWLVTTTNINKSGNLAELSLKQIPVNYTVSATFLRKKSVNKEIGFGAMINKSYKLTVLPVFVFNYNYADNAGIEMMLPKRIAWRRNLSPNDILYLKAESVTRTYYINSLSGDFPGVYRRVDVDMGISYNKKLGNFGGIDISAGYRKNLSSKLIDGAVPIKTSGLALTVDFYVQPPVFHRKR
ncbi:hypothetical protein Dfri01_38490 [Dyadobacter frigoris]|uniref:DUF6268 family outer membrane beta-barrel protein n=1 Tax=Dyadobacter frigoris TaxID=2576211 RepID=UPI0024A46BAD|nr:DUF6268 family outer membrane beta-barrel protein [Dyadobacter frigoris]GLU54388.1 hypothetical protein Dfri01_38490 [Dyadobacter frigoris]